MLVLFLFGALCVLLPLAGAAFAGTPLAPYLAFPPRTEQVAQPSFSWNAALLVAAGLLAVVGVYGFALSRTKTQAHSQQTRPFPRWGWYGVALIVAGMMLGWSRGIVDPLWQRQSFSLIWLGYILAVNAMAYRRAGSALILERPCFVLLLFPVSAVFWWLFEYLNQFVDNWYYTGADVYDDRAYFLQGSLPFATVLPAVASTWYWLATFPRLHNTNLPAIRPSPALAWGALVGGLCGLFAIGFSPQLSYSMLWIGPLLLLLALERLLLGRSFLSPLAHGDWRPALQPPLAALVCGFFWEMWNSQSLVQWHYSIPFMDRFHLFEMPLLGYGGYLPFGIECAAIINLIARLRLAGGK